MPNGFSLYGQFSNISCYSALLTVDFLPEKMKSNFKNQIWPGLSIQENSPSLSTCLRILRKKYETNVSFIIEGDFCF